MDTARWKRRRDGSTLLAVLFLCTCVLLVSASVFSTLLTNRRINSKSQLLAEAREGAEAALALATAEIDRRATSFSSFSSPSMTSYSLGTGDVSFLTGSSSNNNLVPSSIAVKPGAFATSITNLTLDSNDPVYNGDASKGITAGVRSGYVYAKASAKDPLTGQLTTAYASGLVQLREQSWFNYGFFYNMDMEFHPGKQMDIYGAVHSNRDIYLSANGVSLNFYRMVTAHGNIYHGLKYCISSYNADGSATGFQKNTYWDESSGRGSGSVYITSDGGTTLAQMGTSDDCLGAKTSPALNILNWKKLEDNGRWNKNIMDISWDAPNFTPPGMPLYTPEDFGRSSPTAANSKLRNYAYLLIEPPLPTTDNKRYYGRKTVAIDANHDDPEVLENMKFSALAGLTIVVEDLNLTTDSAAGNDSYGNPFYDSDYTTLAGAKSGLKYASLHNKAIPWKLVWYKGGTNASDPVSMGNYPSRTGGVPEILGSIDPFGKNDEVDQGVCGLADTQVTMQRNLKALLRDAIVVVPYHDSDGTTGFGSGATSANITGYTAGSFTPVSGDTRYSQPAGQWPKLNKGSGTASATNVINIYADASTKLINGTTDATLTYPACYSGSAGAPSSTYTYYGMYDRRQGYVKSTDTVSGLQGATCAVYIDLQRLNWILNQPALWKNPKTGDPIYAFDTSYTNIVYVDLPSDAKDLTRFGLANSDKVCHAAQATTTKPGYSVILRNGSRLPRLSTYNDTLRTPGFTIATNGALYIVGNYNADGLDTTGNTFLPDSDASTATTSNTGLWYSSTKPNAEMPALVAADAVTFLTDGFKFSQSNQDRYGADAGGGTRYTYNGYGGSTTVTTDNFQEISTAIITGLVPTIPYCLGNSETRWTGGVNNLPRFLENLGSPATTYCYRGSMAALYESEVADAPFFENGEGNWFSPPTRAWGYHQYLASGFFPPGIYVVRTARLINVSDISAGTYNAAVPTPAN